MLNDSPGLQNPGEFLVAQTVDKLVFIRLKHQTISYKRYKTWQKERLLIARHAERSRSISTTPFEPFNEAVEMLRLRSA